MKCFTSYLPSTQQPRKQKYSLAWTLHNITVVAEQMQGFYCQHSIFFFSKVLSKVGSTFTTTEQSVVQKLHTRAFPLGHVMVCTCRDSCSTLHCWAVHGTGFASDCHLRYVTEFCAAAFPECDSFLHESVMLRHVDLPPVFSLTCSVLLLLLEECKVRNLGTVALICS